MARCAVSRRAARAFAACGRRLRTEVALAAVRSHGLALRAASPQLQGDREVVLAATEQARHLSRLIRSHARIYLYSQMRTCTLEAYSPLGASPSTILSKLLTSLVQSIIRKVYHDNDDDHAQDEEALAWASPELCEDRGFVLDAVRGNGRVLRFAPARLSEPPQNSASGPPPRDMLVLMQYSLCANIFLSIAKGQTSRSS